MQYAALLNLTKSDLPIWIKNSGHSIYHILLMKIWKLFVGMLLD